MNGIEVAISRTAIIYSILKGESVGVEKTMSWEVNKWYKLCVTHSNSKLWSLPDILFYLNDELLFKDKLDYPDVVSTCKGKLGTSAVLENQQINTHFYGSMSDFMLIDDVLSLETLGQLSIFDKSCQKRCLKGLRGSKVVLYLDASVFALDEYPLTHSTPFTLKQVRAIQTKSILTSLISLGGILSLLPLLSHLHLPCIHEDVIIPSMFETRLVFFFDITSRILLWDKDQSKNFLQGQGPQILSLLLEPIHGLNLGVKVLKPILKFRSVITLEICIHYKIDLST